MKQQNISPRNDDQAPYFFHEGTNFHAQDYLGVHMAEDAPQLIFRVWAPNAAEVYLVGDFCDWEHGMAMHRITQGGVWEIAIDATLAYNGQAYKFRIITADGRVLYKADPYAVQMEAPPATASLLHIAAPYTWRDDTWMSFRHNTMSNWGYLHRPINIYELHLGSWRRHEDGSYYSYRDLARELPSYVKQMGYTHIELMPVMEHPYNGSWGYQICGYYAPTARFGSADDFRRLVDAMHETGIGVILDWVPAHFPKDAHGLYEFDGQPLYEYQEADRMEHRGWGTRCFDVGRQEVQCFLISNAVYWAEAFHIDGLRVDAVASMLYLDYDRAPGEWIPNRYGDNRNLEAIAFFRKLNEYMQKTHPDVLMIAEESSAYPGVTTLDGEGLGFSYKWNMGWMNDTLEYASYDPIYRKFHHDKVTFSLTYAFSDHYILPVSHDEVVHGKRSFLDKMPGTYEQKFAGARVFYAWQMTHPGKKLSFMGGEIGQFREWNFEGEIEWFLLEYPSHAGLQRYVADLNHFYLEHRALWEDDDGWNGFVWIDPDNRDESVLSFCRRAGDRAESAESELLVLLNFTPVERKQFRVGVPRAGQWAEVFCSDDTQYGGSGIRNTAPLTSEPIPFREYTDSITLDLPPLSAVFLVCQKPAELSEAAEVKKPVRKAKKSSGKEEGAGADAPSGRKKAASRTAPVAEGAAGKKKSTAKSPKATADKSTEKTAGRKKADSHPSPAAPESSEA